MRLSRIIMLPFAIAGAYIAYEMTFNYRYEWSYYLILPVVVIAACFSLYPQIDALGYKWWPPKVDEKIKQLFTISSPTFQWIPEDQRDDFLIELMTLCRKCDFIGMKVDDIPTDVQAMCLYPGLLLEKVFGIRLMHLYHRVVLYKHPFPSPRYEDWHASEVHTEDHVLLFSLEQLINNYLNPGRFYHVGLDPWIRAIIERGLETTGKEVPIFDMDRASKYLGLTDIPNEVQEVYTFIVDRPGLKAQHSDIEAKLASQVKV